jgi:hypothetical protein
MSHGEQADRDPALPPPASEAGPAILDDCRAARIGDATDFANCLVTTDEPCPHRLAFNDYRYCVHPHREAIVARTLPAELPPGT